MSNIFDLFRSIEKPTSSAPISWLIVGLGNPGSQYDGTRHNIGFRTVDTLANQAGVRIDRAKFGGLVAEATLGQARCLLLKPQTFMNLSGESVAPAAAFYKISPDHIIVFCDDINFAPGQIRIRKNGSAGGHNGLKSIIACLGSQEFVRFKMGVGQKPSPDYDLADWVLGRPDKAATAALGEACEHACEAVKLWVVGGQADAMNRYSR